MPDFRQKLEFRPWYYIRHNFRVQIFSQFRTRCGNSWGLNYCMHTVLHKGTYCIKHIFIQLVSQAIWVYMLFWKWRKISAQVAWLIATGYATRNRIPMSRWRVALYWIHSCTWRWPRLTPEIRRVFSSHRFQVTPSEKNATQPSLGTQPQISLLADSGEVARWMLVLLIQT